jgi:hypothetical protein
MGPTKSGGQTTSSKNLNNTPNLVKFQTIYIYIYILYITITQKGRPTGSTPGPPPIQRLNNNICHHWANRLCWLVHPTFFLKIESSHKREGGRSMVRLGTIFRDTVQRINCREQAQNRDEISQGPGSARVRLRHGDSHFWVIQHHKFNGVVCFLI